MYSSLLYDATNPVVLLMILNLQQLGIDISRSRRDQAAGSNDESKVKVTKLNSKTVSSRKRKKLVTEAPQPKRRKIRGGNCFSDNTSSEVQRKDKAKQSDAAKLSENTNTLLITGRDVRYEALLYFQHVCSMSVSTVARVFTKS